MTAAIRLISGKSPTALEFFAGIGLARAGLEHAGFSVAWANDYEAKKHQLYRSQYGTDTDYHVGDIADVTGSDLPTDAAIAWASSPCTDLSLAGNRGGLDGKQSGTFWHFMRILEEMGENRSSRMSLGSLPRIQAMILLQQSALLIHSVIPSMLCLLTPGISFHSHGHVCSL